MGAKVSICCATYNHEKYIRKTLESFLMQKTNFEFEIIINDDASTDGTADIIREYEQKYPQIVKPIYQTENQHSKKISNFIKHIFRAAQGEYIAVCEGDDFWTDPNKLQKQVDFLDNNQEYIGCVHKYITVDENDNPINIKTFGYYENAERYTIKDLKTKNLPSQLASYVFRNIFYKEGVAYPEWFSEIRLQGDIKYSIYLLAHGDFYRMEDTMSAYRFVSVEGGNSWSSRNNRNFLRLYARWREAKKLEKFFAKEYNKKLNLRKTRIGFALGVINGLKYDRSLKSISNALKVMFLEPRVIFEVLGTLKNKIKKG